MTTITAAHFPGGAPCCAPWGRPGLRPEKAWLCDSRDGACTQPLRWRVA